MRGARAPRSAGPQGRGKNMTKVMAGIRILEVAQFTFVPAAGAVLADWGADVIKIEHPLRGDTQRGFLNMGGVKLDPLAPHADRASQSRQAQRRHRPCTPEEGQQVLYELARTADVFLTNYLPASAPEEQIRRRAYPRGQPRDHLCARQRLGQQGARARQGRLRRHRLLVAQRHCRLHDPGRTARPLVPGHAGFRRFDRRHVHRRRHFGGAVPPRKNRRSQGDGRVADERGGLGLAAPTSPRPSKPGIITKNSMPTSGGVGTNPFMGNFWTSDKRHHQSVHGQPDRADPRHLRTYRPPRMCRRSAFRRCAEPDG